METVASGAGQAEVVEQIDIGGPAMIRAAAKNAESVAVVTSPDRYADVIAALEAGGFDLPSRLRLAAEAFAHTASYDVAVASWLANDVVPRGRGLPDLDRRRLDPLRRAALRREPAPAGRAVRAGPGRTGRRRKPCSTTARRCPTTTTSTPTPLAGRPTTTPSRASRSSSTPTPAASPSAHDAGDPLAEAHRKAHACDPVSAFGGVIATNRPVTVEMAEQIAEIFTEVVCAPGYEDGALEILSRKPSIRLLECPPPAAGASIELRPISGGLLMQEADHIDAPGDDPATWTLQAGDPADEATMRDLAFAWRAIRAVKSNAILLATGGATVGVGMGQVNRVDAARLAVSRAGDRAAGSAAASDAFFPFPDGFEVLAEAGVKAVVEPGGSVRDEEVDRGRQGGRCDALLQRHPPLRPLGGLSRHHAAPWAGGALTPRGYGAAGRDGGCDGSAAP